MPHSDRYQTLASLALDSLSRLARVTVRTMAVSAVGVYVQTHDNRWHRSFASEDYPHAHPQEERLVEALACDDITTIEDALQHPELAEHPWVAHEPGFRFWSVAPLVSSRADERVGLLIVADHEPRSLPPQGRETLADLAALAVERLDLQLSQTEVAAEMDRIITIGVLAAGVAHEINNPLSFVGGNVQFALRLLESDGLVDHLPDALDSQFDDVIDALHDALEGSRRVRDVVRDLHRLAGGSGSGEFTIEPVDVRDPLQTSLNIARKHVEQRARLVTDLDEVPLVMGNESKLGQVFLNLLINAAQAIPAGDVAHNEVRVTTRRRDDAVVVSITDTGEGIPENDREHIFEPFFTTKSPGEGTGLGLAISHSIVTMLSGEIEVATSPGEGTTFRVVLPTLESATTRRPDAREGA